jgi:hypothetical protein
MILFRSAVLGLLLCFAAGAAETDADAEQAAIRDVITRMEAAWNRGDFRA